MYYLLLLLLYPLSLFPLWALYGLSELTNLLLFTLIGYRKKLVSEHLAQAFPEKSPEERRRIQKDFNRAFCDQWIETLKLLSISERSLKKRFTGNWELPEALLNAERPVYALLGHQFNWEWGSVATQYNISGRFAGIYLPQNSKAFDRLMLKIRRRSGALLIPANDMRPAFRALRGTRHLTGFMADQTPANLKASRWYHFLNRPAPFTTGPEKQARLMAATVILVSVTRERRGHYRINFSLLCEDASKTGPGWITDEYVTHLQAELQQHPHNWLWTHRRWKRSVPEGVDITTPG